MEQGKEWEILKREKEGETDSSLLLINEEMMMNFMTGHDMPQYDLHRIAGWPIVWSSIFYEILYKLWRRTELWHGDSHFLCP